MTKLAFIDLEASGLGATSWPIEVGWCFASSGSHAETPETILIAPVEAWPHEAWNAQAQSLHGLTIDKLQKDGLEVKQVCQRLNTALQGVDVYSDAPDWDGFWLYRLFSAAGEKQLFSLRDFGDLLSGVTPEEVTRIIQKATQIAPHRHRACDDVLHMNAIYALANTAAKQR